MAMDSAPDLQLEYLAKVAVPVADVSEYGILPSTKGKIELKDNYVAVVKAKAENAKLTNFMSAVKNAEYSSKYTIGDMAKQINEVYMDTKQFTEDVNRTFEKHKVSLNYGQNSTEENFKKLESKLKIIAMFNSERDNGKPNNQKDNYGKQTQKMFTKYAKLGNNIKSMNPSAFQNLSDEDYNKAIKAASQLNAMSEDFILGPAVKSFCASANYDLIMGIAASKINLPQQMKADIEREQKVMEEIILNQVSSYTSRNKACPVTVLYQEYVNTNPSFKGYSASQKKEVKNEFNLVLNKMIKNHQIRLKGGLNAEPQFYLCKALTISDNMGKPLQNEVKMKR